MAKRWLTEEQVSAHIAKKVERVAAPAKPTGHKAWQALGRLPKGTMNKTEAAYAEYLEKLKLAGEIIDYKFHCMRIRLADNTFYETDFVVMAADRGFEIHEVKGGFTSDKGQVKIKLVGEVMPWFKMLKVIKLPQKDGGGWKFEDYSKT